MRKKAIRSEILRTLKANPDGLTAEQIFNKMREKNSSATLDISAISLEV